VVNAPAAESTESLGSGVQPLSKADKPVHIVQVSFDSDVFNEQASQDSRERQLGYARYLSSKLAGNKLTNLVIVNREYAREKLENLELVSCNCARLRTSYRLFMKLKGIHNADPIHVITTQNIDGHCLWAALFGRLHRVPVVGQIHDDIASPIARKANYSDVYGRWYERVIWLALRMFDGIRTVNQSAKRFLRDKGYRGDITVLPVPSTFLDGRADHDSQRVRATVPRVLFVGRLVPFKNMECWLQTAKHVLKSVRNIQFVIVGDGPSKTALMDHCAEYGIESHVKFVGAQPPDEVLGWYRSSDIFLLTSMYEGFGRVIVEAMRSGVVPVCTDVSGPRDIIEDGVDGFLSPPDPRLLSQYIVRLVEDGSLREEMAKNARQKAIARYDPKKMGRAWMDYLYSFCSQAGDRSDMYKHKVI